VRPCGGYSRSSRRSERPPARPDAGCKIRRPPGCWMLDAGSTARPGEKPQIAQMNADKKTLPTDDTDPPPAQPDASSKIRDARSPSHPGRPQRHRDIEDKWGALALAAFRRGTMGCRLTWVSDGRCERQADDSASCGRAGHCLGCQLIEANGRPMTGPRAGVPSMTSLRGAVFDNVGSTVTEMGGPAGAQHCPRGHPRGTRPGEGASMWCWPSRSRSSGPQGATSGSTPGRGRLGCQFVDAIGGLRSGSHWEHAGERASRRFLSRKSVAAIASALQRTQGIPRLARPARSLGMTLTRKRAARLPVTEPRARKIISACLAPSDDDENDDDDQGWGRANPSQRLS
jgi:hypothetical protein